MSDSLFASEANNDPISTNCLQRYIETMDKTAFGADSETFRALELSSYGNFGELTFNTNLHINQKSEYNFFMKAVYPNQSMGKVYRYAPFKLVMCSNEELKSSLLQRVKMLTVNMGLQQVFDRSQTASMFVSNTSSLCIKFGLWDSDGLKNST